MEMTMRNSNTTRASRRQLLAGVAASSMPMVSPAAAAAAPETLVPDPNAHQRGVTRAYAADAQGQIHYRIAGKPSAKPPLMLLHPSPLSGYVFEVFMATMSRERLVIAPDTPGFGLSDPPPQRPEIADYAGAMLRLARTLKLGKIDVLGYHTGSATAVEMALQSPATVQKLVILGASLLNEAELADFKARYVGRQIDDIPGAFARRWPVFRDKDWRMVSSPARQMNILLDSFRNPDVSHWGHRAALNYPLTEKMRAVLQKTLVINPEDDLWAYTGRAGDLLKNVKVQAYPGWTHGFLDTKASEVSSLIETFLQT